MDTLYLIRAALRDGTQVEIRPTGADDTDREQAFVRALSPHLLALVRSLGFYIYASAEHPSLRRAVKAIQA